MINAEGGLAGEFRRGRLNRPHPPILMISFSGEREFASLAFELKAANALLILISENGPKISKP
jgi:hypothetical protein